jgi:hypothetical protein
MQIYAIAAIRAVVKTAMPGAHGGIGALAVAASASLTYLGGREGFGYSKEDVHDPS